MLSVEYFQDRQSDLLALIERLVELESPATEKEAVDQAVTFVAGQASALGAQIQRYPQELAGDHLTASWGAGSGGVLLLTHLDTVHPLGTFKRFPLSRDGGKLLGPGVIDMKSSVALALYVLKRLKKEDQAPPHRVTLLCTSDEEIGSRTSRALIEELAQQYQLVLCLEPGLADGSLKTRRKGIGVFHLTTMGVPAHAGANPEEGVSAILEMCHQILGLEELNDPSRGISVNAGVIQGGTRSNVIPERCHIELDVRIPTEEAGQWVEERLRELSPRLVGAELELEGGWNRPPMPRTSAIAEAFSRAEVVASELELEIGEGESGGGSDANFVAPYGIPLLDGLGPIGGGAHSNEEFLWIDSLPRRAALLAGLLCQPL
ncbi:MAG: M20 family metallopeptidase [Anaerolineales bacterium]